MPVYVRMFYLPSISLSVSVSEYFVHVMATYSLRYRFIHTEERRSKYMWYITFHACGSEVYDAKRYETAGTPLFFEVSLHIIIHKCLCSSYLLEIQQAYLFE